MTIQPRILRKRDAPSYLGMCPQTFDTLVRPNVTEVPIGDKGIGFDRLELDAWADEYIRCNGRKTGRQGERLWVEKSRQASAKEVKSGTSKKQSGVSDFSKALELVTSKKPSVT
jgi:predicted DNA-binding transcriptional regulator AlpA